MLRGNTVVFFSPKRGNDAHPSFLINKFRFPFSMASAPLPHAPLSSLRFSWPTGCSHEKMPPEAPIELRTARPMVPSAQRDSTELKSKILQTMNFMPPSQPLGCQRVRWVCHPAQISSSSGCLSPHARRPRRAPPPQRLGLTRAEPPKFDAICGMRSHGCVRRSGDLLRRDLHPQVD